MKEVLEKTLKRLKDKNSLTHSEQKSEICKFCKKNEATQKSCQYTYTNDICDVCENKRIKDREDKRIEDAIKGILPIKYRDIESDYKHMFKDLINTSLFITGECGTGKTVFSCSLAKEYIKNNIDVRFISFPAFIMELQSSFKKERTSKYNLYAEDKVNAFELAEEIAKYSDVLIIDDLGAEKLTEYVRQIIYFIINEREQRCFTTIITSNYSLSELDEYIDVRVSSRISGMCKVIKLKGKDRRINK